MCGFVRDFSRKFSYQCLKFQRNQFVSQNTHEVTSRSHLKVAHDFIFLENQLEKSDFNDNGKEFIWDKKRRVSVLRRRSGFQAVTVENVYDER